MKKLICLLTLVAVTSFAFGGNFNAQSEQPAVVDQPIKILKPPIETQQRLNSREYNSSTTSVINSQDTESITSTTSVVNSQSTESIQKGCELLVHIKGVRAKGDFRIFTKEDFAKKDIERGILILVLAQSETAASSKIEPTIEIGDRIIYYKYKENTDKPTKAELFYWFEKLRRIKRLLKDGMEKEKYLPYDFTYYEFMNAVEKLVFKDEIKLAGDTITVKKRVIKELPDNLFTIATRPPRCCD